MISIIVAMAKNNVIGRDNAIPWHITEDYVRTDKITSGHPIIMGRKSFESISGFKNFEGTVSNEEIKLKLLPRRTNIVLSPVKDFEMPEGGFIATSIEEALEIAKKAPGSEEIFIFGGASIYKQFLPLADKMYITYIDHDVEGDVFFPEFSETEWKRIKRRKKLTRVNDIEIRYEFRQYIRSAQNTKDQ